MVCFDRGFRLALSACAQPALIGSLNKNCSDQAAADLGAMPVIINLPRNLSVNVVDSAAYGRLGRKTSDCAQPAPAPSLHDLDKVGEQPHGALTASTGSCHRSRA